MSDIILELRVPTMCYDMVGKCYTESTMEEAADYIEQLEAKLAAAEKDAERWRKFRTVDWIDDAIGTELGVIPLRPETLDAAIDAARGEDDA